MAKFGVNDLVMTADLPYTHEFTYPRDDQDISWADYEVHLQMRDRVTGDLLIELTAFLAVDPDDPTKLVLDIDATFTRHLAHEGRWDILAIGPEDENLSFRTPQPPGRIIVLPGVTQR